MLYLFTGNNRYLIQQEALRWKQEFCKKYGEENVVHIQYLDDISLEFIDAQIFSRSLFSEKRLIIIDGFPFSSETKISWATQLEEYFLSRIENIQEDTFVVFLSHNPDKRKKSYTFFKQHATIKDFSLQNTHNVSTLLSQKYRNIIENAALEKLVFLKWGSLEKSINEIEKLTTRFLSDSSQTKNTLRTKITLKEVQNYIIPEYEESIFVFIDTLLAKDEKKVFHELRNLLEYSNIYALYQSIIANLRIFLYIDFLKYQWKTDSEIEQLLTLGKRNFLIRKSHKARIKDIQSLYTNLLRFDSRMKTGKLVSSQEEDIYRSFENVFITYLAIE